VSAQLQPGRNHVGIEENQKRNEPQEKFPRNGDLKVNRSGVHNGAWEQDCYQPRPYQDARDHNNDPLLKVALFQQSQLLAKLGEDAVSFIFRLHV